MWEQHCYDSVLAGKAVSAEDHRLAVYVTLPGPAWDAMLRHSARKTPIHLITDEQAYADVRSSVMGGLSCIFQPFAQANNPELGEEDYKPNEPASWISYLDFNAMYPAAMTLPMPNGGRKRSKTQLAAQDVPLGAELGVRLEVSSCSSWTTTRSCTTTWTGLAARMRPVRAAHSGHGGAPRSRGTGLLGQG